MSDADNKNNNRPEGEEAVPTASFADGLERPGGQVGPYKLLSILGEGGCGMVYLAEQLRPVKRRVALKVIKPGMDTKQVIARFEAERQALALLDHPNIAHVFNAGATEAGRPYFVMEHVKGVPITEHCDRQKLSIDERLDLFLQVCEAVQHAHQKGIIHRDIKPSNILVSIEGGKAIPKIIDFGVAKAISQSLTERTLYTEQGQLLGTPEYMSPEQAEMTNQDIDTRSDIYSLGVVLYVLLTGVLPFDPKTLREGGVDSIRQVIRESEPKTPSTRLTSLGEEAKTVAQRRRTDVSALVKRLHRELEWIPLKAIRKDRTRRYRSASEFADDIENYLNGAPLIAGPESASYRLQKFVRKHRVPLTAVTAVAVALVIGFIVSTAMYVRAQRALDRVARLESRMEIDRVLSTAQRLHAEGRYEAALEEIEAALEEQDLGPKAHLLHAQSLFEVGRLIDAEGKLQLLTEGEPEIAGAAHYLLARINLGVDSAKANEHRQRAELMLPKTAEAYSLRAMTAKTPEEGFQWLSKAVSLDPTHYSSRKERALLSYGLKDYQNMMEDVATLIALRPEDYLGYALRAVVRREAGRFDEAIDDHSHAIEVCTLATELPALYNQRRETYFRMGDHRAALEDAQGCVELGPKEFAYRFHLFTALVSLGEYQAARQEYEKIAEESPARWRRFKIWAKKYVFSLLEMDLRFELPADVAHKAPFASMHEAAEYYRMLESRATRLPVTAEAPCSFSPDGKQFVYERNAEYARQRGTMMAAAPTVSGPRGIYIMNLETGRERLLATFGMHAVWSPNGEYVAFKRGSHATRTHRDEILVIRTAGGEPRRLAFGHWPVWGMDSNRLFFRSVDDMLCCVDVDDPAAKPKTLLPCPGYFALSPDEKYVAIGCENSKEIRIVGLSSRSVVDRWVPPLPQYSWPVKWSPNAKELSLGYWSYYGEVGLWIYDIEGKQAWHVLDSPARSSVWSPDGSRMAIHVLDDIWLARLDPNFPTYQQLGTALTHDDYVTEELRRQSRRIEMDPLNAENYVDRALFHISLQEYERANADLEACGRLVKSNDDPVLSMMDWWAWSHHVHALYKGAELLYLQTTKVKLRICDTEPSATLNNLIKLYEAWDKLEQAEQWREKLPPEERTAE